MMKGRSNGWSRHVVGFRSNHSICMVFTACIRSLINSPVLIATPPRPTEKQQITGDGQATGHQQSRDLFQFQHGVDLERLLTSLPALQER